MNKVNPHSRFAARPRTLLAAVLPAATVLLAAVVFLAPAAPLWAQDKPWAFVVVGDPRPGRTPSRKGHIKGEFEKDLAYLKATFVDQATADRPAPSFVVVTGDFDPPALADSEFRKVLGDRIPWLPVLGNHDLGYRSQVANVVSRLEDTLKIQRGPKGTEDCQYYFTYRDLTFVAFNQYWDGRERRRASDRLAEVSGGLSRTGLAEENLAWLDGVLAASTSRYKVVSAHEPAWPFARHTADVMTLAADTRDRFWKILSDRGCQLFLCGHTHFYSTYQWLGNADPNRWHEYVSKRMPQPVGVWQLDAGADRGPGFDNDRVIVYCRVTPQCIETEAHIAAATPTGFDPWEVPADRLHELGRLRISPDVRANLPAKLPAAAQPADQP